MAEPKTGNRPFAATDRALMRTGYPATTRSPSVQVTCLAERIAEKTSDER
jgi:hypothetical protein